MRIQDTPTGKKFLSAPPPAQEIQGAVELNTAFNWLNPEALTVLNVTTGQNEVVDFVAATNQALGTALTRFNISPLIILHEFRHVLGAPQETDPIGFNRSIVKNCIE
jgi:hypothetical protein